ncbi:putative inactive DNA (cytosine-5)-methyltransferase DRM3 isoform X1 [Prunus yedoensis var. nudiflora]|uniref:Putative inactive DNA (Cytosine-5)-methyltransferase DRM3 isoform X1 n=1 Tax=Prunus yedoensis var. nudiflora TaxID=2094558 RepID=A0A314U9Q5_PRUYE|nr:putative inactive DNA (cytosine-5)-methyltransferase DRM3 isoform X1 [Prunus yedoensis var. nudiflora]
MQHLRLNLIVFFVDGDWRPSLCSLWSIVILYFPSLLQLIHFKKVNMTNYSNRKSSSEQECEKAIVPKEEILDFELPSNAAFSGHFGNNAASSSQSNTRSDLIGMGFLPSLVDKVIEQKGEGDVELLLETLLSHSGSQKSDSGSSDSLDSLFDDKDESSPPEVSNIIQPKEEPDLADGLDERKRASLLMMNFSPNEAPQPGEDAPINDLVDFIIAAQVAVKLENDIGDSTTHGDEEKDEDANDEKLYGTMEKTLRLLEMGFSENQVSWAIEKFGSRAPIGDLADSIVAYQISDDCYKENKYSAHSNHSRTGVGSRFFATDHMIQLKLKVGNFIRIQFLNQGIATHQTIL